MTYPIDDHIRIFARREGRLRKMVYALAPLIGALFTLMNSVNSDLSKAVGSLVAVLVIHVTGLVTVSILLLARREERRPGRVPLLLYLGGFFGVGTVFANNYAFASLGASLAVALALIGQTIFSVAADSTGLLGRKLYPLAPRRIPGIALALVGAAIMAGNWRTDGLAMLCALAAGVIPGFTFILNSELARKKGIFRGTRINYIGGLATTLAIVAVIRPPVAESARALAAAGPILALAGGILGVAGVGSMNFIYPRMPAFSASILVFSGQALAGLAIDAAVSGALDLKKLLGTAILLAGLAINALLERRPS
jgi:bacterial/archaeal transporter family-2 protein